MKKNKQSINQHHNETAYSHSWPRAYILIFWTVEKHSNNCLPFTQLYILPTIINLSKVELNYIRPLENGGKMTTWFLWLFFLFTRPTNFFFFLEHFLYTGNCVRSNLWPWRVREFMMFSALKLLVILHLTHFSFWFYVENWFSNIFNKGHPKILYFSNNFFFSDINAETYGLHSNKISFKQIFFFSQTWI